MLKRKNSYLAILLTLIFLINGNVMVYANENMPYDDYIASNRPYVEIVGEIYTIGREPRNQLLVSSETVVGNNGFWERSFQTVGSATGNRLNLWYRNDTAHSAIVRVERRNANGTWTSITQMTVSANSEQTRQFTLLPIEFNAQMRVTVSNASGNRVEGVVSVRQTSNPL